ncbi:MAG: glycosyltransferase family 4 protein [Chitinophagaceae bacterium]
MHIAIVCDGVHPYVMGGMQRHTYYLVKYLSRMGIKITLVHFNMSKLDIHKLEVFTEQERAFIENIVLDFPKGDKLPGHYVRASYKYSCMVFELLKDRMSEFDFIYSKGFSAWKIIREKQKNPSAFPPVGVKFHGYEMFQKQADVKSLLKSLLLRRPVRWISLNADYVFSYGSKITEIIKSLGVRPASIIEIPAGIEKEWMRESEIQVNFKRRFVYLGRYERRKGIEELNKAIQQLSDLSLPFEFHFIGPFTDDQKLRTPGVFYHGAITDNDTIRNILDQSDFLVCPSWSEGMPNVILEGMARACAIIATDVGATSIMLSNDNGLTVKTGSIDDLVIQIKKAIVMSEAEILSLKLSSLLKVKEKFVYERILNKFVDSIQTIIKK